MSFRLESELAEPIAAWLEAAGFRVRMEVPILRRRADLLGLRRGTVTAIETKMSNWTQALRQAMAYQLGADQSWVAMPLAAASRAFRQRWHFEAQKVGLLAIDDRGGVRTAIPAGPSPRLLPFLRDKILQETVPEILAKNEDGIGSEFDGDQVGRYLPLDDERDRGDSNVPCREASHDANDHRERLNSVKRLGGHSRGSASDLGDLVGVLAFLHVHQLALAGADEAALLRPHPSDPFRLDLRAQL